MPNKQSLDLKLFDGSFHKPVFILLRSFLDAISPFGIALRSSIRFSFD